MRNLLILFYRYHATILFVVLEVIGLSLAFSLNTYQRASIINSTQEIVGITYNAYDQSLSYLSLGKENDSLLKENARLRFLLEEFKPRKDSITRISSHAPSHYRFIPARVINNSISSRNNFITLDRGEYDGVNGNMAVLNEKGIVGILKGSSGNFASGISVLHGDFSLSAQIQENEENGSIRWDGKKPGFVLLEHIPRHVKVKKGQHVVVSPYSFIFPPGTPIGIVEDFKLNEGDAFYDIRVKLHNDMRNVHNVYVVENTLQSEKKKLEEETRDE